MKAQLKIVRDTNLGERFLLLYITPSCPELLVLRQRFVRLRRLRIW
jgi:hypothetical protein